MDKKKIIISIIVFLLILSAVFVFIHKSNNPGTSDNPQSQATNAPISSGSVNLPTQTPPPPTVNSILVNNPADQATVKSAFNQFAQASTPNFSWTDLNGNDKKNIPLDDFSQAVGLNVNSEVNPLLDKSKFDLFSCPSQITPKGIGLVLNAKLLPNYQGDLYKNELKFMKTWESTLFQDTQKVLFPDIAFTPEQLNQKPTFQQGKYRYAEISLPDGAKSSLNYAVLDDFIVIANSPDCLSQAASQLLDTSN